MVVLLPNPRDKWAIKAVLDTMAIPSQFVLVKTAQKKTLAVNSNIIKQMNAKVTQDLYRLHCAETAKTMIVGVDLCHAGRGTIFGFLSSYN